MLGASKQILEIGALKLPDARVRDRFIAIAQHYRALAVAEQRIADQIGIARRCAERISRKYIDTVCCARNHGRLLAPVNAYHAQRCAVYLTISAGITSSRPHHPDFRWWWGFVSSCAERISRKYIEIRSAALEIMGGC